MLSAKRIYRAIMRRTRQPWLQRHLSSPRTFRYDDITLHIPPGVFHPGFFYSTGFLIRHLEQVPLKGKTFLELGCGSGLISLLASRKGASVTASDINPTAVETLRQNAALNNIAVTVLHSDLFSGFSPQPFDLIVINPPYYKKDPLNDGQYAWYCGKNMEYFSRLFSGIMPFLSKEGKIIMILSDDCDIPSIFSFATEAGLRFNLVWEKTYRFEKHLIYHLSR